MGWQAPLPYTNRLHAPGDSVLEGTATGRTFEGRPGQQADPAHTIAEAPTVTRILIVEDNEDLAFGLRRTLEAQGYQVQVAGDGELAVQFARSLKPDLVILDLMLPGIDGYAVLSTMRREGMDSPVLILSAKGEETDKVHGLSIGADDYVTKPFGLSELLARVTALLRRTQGDRGATDTPITFSEVEINALARTVSKRGETVALTPKELDLLLAFVRRPGAVLARTELLRDVWGHAADMQTRTVDMHVAELRRKLEDDPANPRHFATVWKAGYRFDP